MGSHSLRLSVIKSWKFVNTAIIRFSLVSLPSHKNIEIDFYKLLEITEKTEVNF